MGPCNEVLDPMNQRILVTRFPGIGHFAGDEQRHLTGIIKRRTHLKPLSIFTPYPSGHIAERRN